MRQIYKRIPKSKCDLKKIALQFYWNHTSACVFSCKFAAYFQNTIPWEPIWWKGASEELNINFRSEIDFLIL